MTKPPDALLQALRSRNRFLITGHINPDGDSIGSALALARILRSQGKGAVIWNRDATPKIYSALPGAGAVRTGEEPPSSFPAGFDAAIVLECPTLDRSGLEGALAELPQINIDHHLGNTLYGEVNWVDTSAPSLGEMIHRLAKGLNQAVDGDTATCLFVTLVTDTGGFRFANTSAEAFEAAADLVREGARPDQVAHLLFENRTPGSLRLLGELLGSLEISDDGRLASVSLTSEMFERAGAEPADTEGLIDVPRSIAGLEAVALLRQTGDGEYKVSLRSRGEIDVQRVALRHGGGGHRNAAGYKLSGDLADLRAQVVDELAKELG